MAKEGKHNQSISIKIERSKLTPHPLNPRHITESARQLLKKSIKLNGVVGGIVFNRQTGFIVGGHQRLSVLDEINKYDGTIETDYFLNVEVIDIDKKAEKELMIMLNSQSAQGTFDDELMRQLIKDIDYKNAGLDEFDLNYYGVPIPELENNSIADELNTLYQPIAEQNEIEKEARKEAVKEAKKDIQEKAIEKAKNMTAYITLSFDNYQNKTAFCRRFGIPDDATIIKGEEYSDKVEVTY